MRALLLPVVTLALFTCISPGSAQAPPATGTLVDAASRGLLVYNAANQHHYQAVRAPEGVSFERALAAASSRTFGGVRGHLACISDAAEQTFINDNLFAENYWIGAFRDRQAPDYRQKTAGWRWITGEPFTYTNWNDTEPNNRDNEPAACLWSGHRWMDIGDPHKVGGYVIEFPTTGPQGDASRLAGAQVEALLARVQAKTRGLRSYQASILFSVKPLLEQGSGVNMELIYQTPGRFRLEGRGNNGSLIAVSDGRAFVLARTYPREPMHWMVRRAQGLQSLQEAMSLIMDAPLPPSLLGFLVGAVPPAMWGGGVRLSGCTEEAPQEEMIRSRLKMRFIGDDPRDAEAILMVSIRDSRILTSEINYRDSVLHPITVKEVHSNVRINEGVPAVAFMFQPTSTAIQVDDLGERPDEVSYTPGRR